MPRLSELTDYDPMGSFTGAQPVAEPVAALPSPLSNNIDKILNSLFRPDEKRLQLWPERVVREGITAAGKVASGEVPQWAIDPATGDVHTSPQMVEKAQELSALAGSGGLASGGGSLNATPSLRPALRHKEKLYKGKPGQEHQDIIPDSLYNDFQKKAMAGQDLADYNFGFVNDKGHFLSREDALKYGIDNGLIDPQAGKFGTLTSTMFADSSKPGTAIESLKAPKFDFKPGESSGSRSVKVGPTEITYGVNPKNNDVELSLIRTDKSKRGEGSARTAIEQFIAEADANGKRVLLNADPMDKSTSKNKLVDFYKSLGFVRNQGKNKDFTTRSEFIRDPVVKSDPTPLPPGYELKPVEYNPFEQKT